MVGTTAEKAGAQSVGFWDRIRHETFFVQSPDA